MAVEQANLGADEIGGIRQRAPATPLHGLYTMWDQLADAAVDEEGALDVPFLHFPKGTPREDVWAWFETRNPHFVVAEVQRGIRRGAPLLGVPAAPVGRVEKALQRGDGSEVKIVAQMMYGAGLHCSIDVYVLQRESAAHPWHSTSNRPHPDWHSMSVDEYARRGRSEILTLVSHAEILKVVQELVNGEGAQTDQEEGAEASPQRAERQR